MKITFAKPEIPESGVVVATALEGRVLSAAARALDERTGGAIGRALKASRFQGKKGQVLTLLAPGGGHLEAIHLIGLGKPEDLGDTAFRDVGGGIYATLAGGPAAIACVCLDALEGCKVELAAAAAQLAYGALLRSFRFDRYLTKEEADDKPALRSLKVACEGYAKARPAFQALEKVADGVFLTRALVSEPANVLYPETLAAEARKLADLGLKVKVLGEREMKKLGMNALLGVGQGSAHDSALVTLEWDGTGGRGGKGRATDAAEGPIAFVGKGVTFDTGGISIKPAAGMEDMKWDMGGAAVVIGLMKALAGRKAKVHAVGVVGLVENMPSGTAQRPGDIVTSMSGQTIEVLNTDAEGRLVLADALHYCKETFKPRAMIDLATLTGAIIICLGEERAGLFANDDALAEALFKAGEDTGERLWRMPLAAEYDALLKSDAADMKNIGGRSAGSITAAQFLKRFVGEVPWAHLDIAGVTWSKKDLPTAAKGGTAFGVRLLDHLVAQRYEER